MTLSCVIDRDPDVVSEFLSSVDSMEASASDPNNLRGTDLILICVQDRHIHEVCRDLGARSLLSAHQIVLHTSGVTGKDCFAPLTGQTDRVGVMHPYFSFTQTTSSDSIRNIWYGLDVPRDIAVPVQSFVLSIGGKAFDISGIDRALYHASAVFASNYLTVIHAIARHLLVCSGVDPASVRSIIEPLMRITVENTLALPFGAALTGPLIRGDLSTVETHLEALSRWPQIHTAYQALAEAALRILDSGSSKNSDGIETGHGPFDTGISERPDRDPI